MGVFIGLLVMGICLLVFRKKIIFKIDEKLYDLSKTAAGVGIAIMLFAVVNTSFVTVGSNEVGLMKKVLGWSNLPSGRIIATKGEKGYQSVIISPGVHFMFLVNLAYDIEKINMLEVPAGQLAILTALDGVPLRKGQYIADGWKHPDKDMVDVTFFLDNGGQKGPQLDVLRPGKHRLNTYLWKYKLVPATVIEAGEVGVIKSNVGGKGKEWLSSVSPNNEARSLSVILVKKGGFGVWDEPLPPGTYYLNPNAYTVYPISTRMFSWTYKGGYSTQSSKLVIGKDGNVEVVTGKDTTVPIPSNAADGSIVVKSKEGWEIPTDWRVQALVKPENAPWLVASVGGIVEAENRAITPVIRAEARNQSQYVSASAFLSKRSEIEEAIEKIVRIEAEKVGITVNDVRMANIDLPPILRLAIARVDLAKKMKKAYIQEEQSYKARITSERSRALADQQPILVKAEIAKQASKLYKETQKNKGTADRNYLTEVAKGQKAQSLVLGKKLVYQLKALEMILRVMKDNPKLVKVPHILVTGSESSLAGAAAVLGNSNLTNLIRSIQK